MWPHPKVDPVHHVTSFDKKPGFHRVHTPKGKLFTVVLCVINRSDTPQIVHGYYKGVRVIPGSDECKNVGSKTRRGLTISVCVWEWADGSSGTGRWVDSQVSLYTLLRSQTLTTPPSPVPFPSSVVTCLTCPPALVSVCTSKVSKIICLCVCLCVEGDDTCMTPCMCTSTCIG